MVRKLALAVSFALGTISVPVYALGLGELSSKSTLNQNFEGNIPLLSVLPEELDGVRVSLADAAIFERAGVERPFYLSLLKFEPVLTDSGKTVVRVTSEFPIREPFLNFLVEVNWPKGRLVREYTVLLDPPTTTMRRAPKVSPAATAARTAAPQPKPAVAASPASTAAVASASGSEYGPVKANDTAWRIAEQVRPNGVSMEQMMMALLEANPQAFIDGNINRLRKGQILRVPSAPEIQQLSRQQARQAFRQQQDAWLAQRNQRPQATATVEVAGETEVAAGDAATAQPDADRLRIATARPEGEGKAGAGDDAAESTTPTDLETRLIAARENAETSRQEAEMMRSRVDDLQARLEKMQKLLSLKDEQLAQLQDRVATEGVTATPEAALEELALANQIDAAERAAAQAAEGVDEVPPATVVAEELAVPEMAPTMVVPGSDYQIEDIPPQIDPDRIVEAAERGEDLSAYLPGDVAGEGGVEMADTTALDVDLPGVQADAEIVVDPDRPVADEIVVGVQTSEAESAMTQPAPAMPDAAPTPEAPVAVDSGSTSIIPQPIARMIEQNVLPIAGAGVALLALIGWGATRRRRQAKPVAGPAPAAPAAVAVAVAETKAKAKAPEPAKPPVDQPTFDGEALEDLPDSTLLDDFSQSDINALQDETGEVDPVSEADVYIAYGRYQQAEELLRQALGRDPNRLALKHKLLEVHYATKNSGAFAALAQE
ncbi:MAG: FimV/HubP family polar landmark protein, partial [Sedimenticolaceae bacterium]